MNSKSAKLINNATVFMVGSIGTKIIQFFLVPLYTYTLNKEEYGVAEIVLTAVSILVPVFSMSVSEGLLRFGLSKNDEQKSVLKGALFVVFIGSISSLIMTPLLSLNASLREWIVYFILILNLRMYRDLFAINLKICNKNKLFAIDGILYTLELCGSSIFFLVFLKAGIEGYLLAYFVAESLSIVYLIIVGRPFDKPFGNKLDKSIVKKLIIYSLPLIVNGVAWWITNASDRFMLEMYLDDSSVGLYSVAAKMPSIIISMTGVFNQAWIMSAVVEYDGEKEIGFYERTLKKYYTILFLCVMFFLALIKFFMKIYVNSDYYDAWKSSAVLICGAAMSGVAAFTGGFYAATKRNTNLMITTLIGAVSNIGLNMFLISRFGIVGAAIATYISWGVIASIRLIDIKRIVQIKIKWLELLFYIIIITAECCLIYWGETLGIILACVLVIIAFIKERRLIKDIIDFIFNKFKRLLGKGDECN